MYNIYIDTILTPHPNPIPSHPKASGIKRQKCNASVHCPQLRMAALQKMASSGLGRPAARLIYIKINQSNSYMGFFLRKLMVIYIIYIHIHIYIYIYNRYVIRIN